MEMMRMVEKPIPDDVVNRHCETFNDINRKIMGLHFIASALESRSKIVIRDTGVSSTSEALDFNAKVIHEVANDIKKGLLTFVDQENEILEQIDKSLKEVNRMRGL